MDIFWHGLSGILIVKTFKKNSSAKLGFLFGSLPDILGGTGPFLYSLILKGTIFWQAPTVLINIYFLTHSILAILILFLVLLLFKKEYLVLPYSFHLVIDYFTHKGLISQIFFPLKINIGARFGINWWENYFIVVFLYFFLILGLGWLKLKKNF